MPTSKSKPDLHYPCKGGCGATLTYVRRQRGGTKPVWCAACAQARHNELRRRARSGTERRCARCRRGTEAGSRVRRCPPCRLEHRREMVRLRRKR